MKINVAKVIRDLGGPEAIVEWVNGQLKPGEAPITVKAVEKWRERGSIPMKRWLMLTQMADKKRIKKFKLDNYILPTNGNGR